jgi:ABC-type iron transport system FetAB permease component
MDPSPPNIASHVSWSHVGLALVFVSFNSTISQALRLRIGASLLIAALRCMAQLTVVAIILQNVAVKKLWAVVGIVCMFTLALETFARA